MWKFFLSFRSGEKPFKWERCQIYSKGSLGRQNWRIYMALCRKVQRNHAYCWLCCFGSKQAQTHPSLPDQCKRAGRSVQTGAGSSPHQNKSQIHLSHMTAWNAELHIKQKGKNMLFSGSQTSGTLFAVSILAVCFLALEQSLWQNPTKNQQEGRQS